jgi:hypothetical protein
VDAKSTIAFTIGYHGLKGRILRSSGAAGLVLEDPAESLENDFNSNVIFRLDRIESEVSRLVEKLCSPLFLLFDFFKLDPMTYERIVSNFVAGKITKLSPHGPRPHATLTLWR